MSVENVKKFYEDLSKDAKLKEKVQQLQNELSLQRDASQEVARAAILPIAQKLGYDFSKEDLENYASEHEMSDDMLEQVSGGVGCFIVGGGGGCGCAVGGGGQCPGNGDRACVCVIYGDGVTE